MIIHPKIQEQLDLRNRIESQAKLRSTRREGNLAYVSLILLVFAVTLVAAIMAAAK